ncbi:MAG: hypothetical protein WCK90_04985 [archaeon]
MTNPRKDKKERCEGNCGSDCKKMVACRAIHVSLQQEAYSLGKKDNVRNVILSELEEMEPVLYQISEIRTLSPLPEDIREKACDAMQTMLSQYTQLWQFYANRNEPKSTKYFPERRKLQRGEILEIFSEFVSAR